MYGVVGKHAMWEGCMLYAVWILLPSAEDSLGIVVVHIGLGLASQEELIGGQSGCRGRGRRVQKQTMELKCCRMLNELNSC